MVFYRINIMDFKLIGAPCGHHGPYTFYKAFKYSKNGKTSILSLSEFFFVKLWNDSDLVSIGELQLLWEDKNSEQTLASLRLYILPESTPEGRNDFHGEHEVLAITEKVVLRVEDLLTWITEAADWSWGLPAIWDRDCPGKMSVPPRPQLLSDYTAIDLGDVDKEKDQLDESHWETSCGVVVLSFPRYCRYRGILKRLEGVQNKWLRTALVIALGGFTVPCRNTRVLFCKETFDYPDLEGHELLCNHLAPKLKGRPRRKRRKATLSPDGSESESESSLSTVSSVTKNTKSKPSTPTKSSLGQFQLTSPTLPPPESSSVTITTVSSSIGTRRSNRNPGSPEEKEFLSKLYLFMKSRQTPINRVPSIGFKEIDLYKFYNKVKHLGGYDVVTSSRLWKYVYEEMGGDHGSTSAATCSRRHYEKLLLAYERSVSGSGVNKAKPSTIVKPRKSTDSVERTVTSLSSVTATITTNSDRISTVGKTSLLRSVRLKPEKSYESTASANNPPRDKENIPIVSERSHSLPEVIDLASDDSPTKINPSSSPNFKKQKLEILKEGGLEVTPIATISSVNGGPSKPPPSEEVRPSVIRQAVTTENSKGKVSITVTPDVSHMLVTSAVKATQRHAWSLGSQSVYGNPKDIVHGDERRVNTGEVLDLRTKGNSRPTPSFGPIGSNLEITLVPAASNNTVSQQRRKRSQPEQQPIPQRLNNIPPRLIPPRLIPPRLTPPRLTPPILIPPRLSLPPQKLVHQQRPKDFHLPQRLPNPSVIPNGRLPHPMKKSGLIIPSVSISVNQQQQNQHQQLQQQQKRGRHKTPPVNHSFPNSNLFPGYKSQTPPYIPMVDPVYLSAALYGGLFSPNLFPSSASPTSPHHLQVYKELMHRHVPTAARASFPDNFPRLIQDGSTSITLVGQSTTPTSK